MARFYDLTFERIVDGLENKLDDYAETFWHDEDVRTEIVEKFLQDWHNVSFDGMKKTEADLFVEGCFCILSALIKQREYEQEQKIYDDEDLPF